MSKKYTLAVMAVLLSAIAATPILYSNYAGTHTILSNVDCNKCHQVEAIETAASNVTWHKTLNCLACHLGTNSSGKQWNLNTSSWAAIKSMSSSGGQTNLRIAFHAMTFTNSSFVLCSCHTTEIANWTTGAHYNFVNVTTTKFMTVQCWMCHSLYTPTSGVMQPAVSKGPPSENFTSKR
jgi:hypothetical protein